MSRLFLCLLILSLSACASRNEMPDPINGACGIMQDACTAGDASNTDDNSAPYEWTCTGRRGGTPAFCSVSTAGIEDGEVFAGKNALEERIKAEGPMEGLLTIRDHTINHPECEPPYCHALVMKRYAMEMGIPEENIYLSAWPGDEDPALVQKTFVFAHPTAILFFGITLRSPDGMERFWERGALHIAAAGNTDGEPVRGRSLWYRNHENWAGEKGKERWLNAFDSFATGRVIIAKYAIRGNDGSILPYEGNVKCGKAKEFCYSIFAPDGQNHGTSGASVNLGALAFYLFQLWDTPRAVVNTLNICAEDVGELGIDEEFGRGIVSVVCRRVRNREVQVAAGSLRGFGLSPVRAELLRQPGPGFRPFGSVRGRTAETLAGHLGGRFRLRGTDLLVSGGADWTPLGIASTLLRQPGAVRRGGRPAEPVRAGPACGVPARCLRVQHRNRPHGARRSRRSVVRGRAVARAGWLSTGTRDARHSGTPAGGRRSVRFMTGNPDARVAFSVGF